MQITIEILLQKIGLLVVENDLLRRQNEELTRDRVDQDASQDIAVDREEN